MMKKEKNTKGLNMDYNKMALEMHKKYQGKISVESKVEVATKDDLSTAYTPGVAEPCREIHKNKALVYDYTAKGNMVAVVSDGTAVLGLGDIGPEAALPVMEGKAVLFKKFGDVDAFPICLDTKDVDEIVRTIELMAPTFGGVNLEDIAAPRCFEIEKKLKEKLDIPIFHDDQHGTAIVTLAGIINALKLAEKNIEDVEVVINGAGSAGIAIAKLLLSVGVKNIVLCDREGAIYKGMVGVNSAKAAMAEVTNSHMEKGTLAEVIENKDIFIGVSAPHVVTKEMIAKMAEKAIVFAMANPVPEIMPEEALAGGAFIVGTGRSDFPNQVNNVLAFPGIFRGALDVRASDINEAMKLAAAYAIANTLETAELSRESIIPKAFDLRVGKNVAKAVAEAAVKSGISRQ